MKHSPKAAILASWTFAGLALVDVSVATDWEIPIAREAASGHESLDAYRPYCRTLGLPQNRAEWGEGPWNASFCSVNRFSASTTDFDEVDDVRDFTSEALFAASGLRLNRALTAAELRDIVRRKDKVETFNSLKLNTSKYLPAMEMFYRYRELEQTQITHFFAPNEFNDVTLSEYGFGLSKRIPLSEVSEITLRGGYRRIDREGIVEFLPEAHEDIDHREAGARWDWVQGRQNDGHYAKEAGVSLYYVYQDIDQRIANGAARDRDIFAARARYKTDLPAPGGFSAVEIFGGVAFDEDGFGNVSVNKHDYFAGATLFQPASGGYWAFTFQPAVFTSTVSNDASQDNSQYRINLVVGRYFYTGTDAWLAIVFPYRRDEARDGPEDFENFKFGAEIQCKQLTGGSGHLRWFGSIGLDYQEFHRVAKRIHGVSANRSASF